MGRFCSTRDKSLLRFRSYLCEISLGFSGSERSNAAGRSSSRGSAHAAAEVLKAETGDGFLPERNKLQPRGVEDRVAHTVDSEAVARA